MDKREFLKNASLFTVLSAFGLTMESCSDDETPTPSGGSKTVISLTESPYSSLTVSGTWVMHESKNILLVNAGGTISAFSSVCTHQGCSDNWSFGTNATCGCHGSTFNSSGAVVTGPASRSLSKITVTRDGDTLTLG